MTQRQDKLRELLKEEISDICRRELKDPRLGFLTITDAEITPDLRQARVYVSVLGTPEERQVTIGVLKRSEHFVRRAFAKRVTMKTLPEIEFRLDESAERGAHVFELLQQIKRDEQEEAS